MTYLLLNRGFLIVLGILMGSMGQAHAYIDPGSGSYLFQLLIAGLTGTVFFFHTIRKSLVATIKSWFKRSRENDSADDKQGS